MAMTMTSMAMSMTLEMTSWTTTPRAGASRSRSRTTLTPRALPRARSHRPRARSRARARETYRRGCAEWRHTLTRGVALARSRARNRRASTSRAMSIMSYNGAAVIGACIRPRARTASGSASAATRGSMAQRLPARSNVLGCARERRGMRAFDPCTRASHRYAPY